MIRAYVKYLRQTGFPFSQPTIESTLVRHAATTKVLAELFERRFDPVLTFERDERVEAMRVELAETLDDPESRRRPHHAGRAVTDPGDHADERLSPGG